jgi:hypothetical protein
MAGENVAVVDIFPVEDAAVVHDDLAFKDPALTGTAFTFQAGVRHVDASGEHDVDECLFAWPA